MVAPPLLLLHITCSEENGAGGVYDIISSADQVRLAMEKFVSGGLNYLFPGECYHTVVEELNFLDGEI